MTYPEQRGPNPVNVRGQDSIRGQRARLTSLLAAIALLPAVAGCSSSSSVDYVGDTYPSQSLVNLLKKSTDLPPNAQKSEPAPAGATANAATPPTSAPPPPTQSPTAPPSGANPVAQTAPAPPASATEHADPVAAAFPSVSLIDLLVGEKKPSSQ